MSKSQYKSNILLHLISFSKFKYYPNGLDKDNLLKIKDTLFQLLENARLLTDKVDYNNNSKCKSVDKIFTNEIDILYETNHHTENSRLLEDGMNYHPIIYTTLMENQSTEMYLKKRLRSCWCLKLYV